MNKETHVRKMKKRLECKWSTRKDQCILFDSKNHLASQGEFIKYQSVCPLQPPYPPESPHFLGDWMSHLMDLVSFSRLPLSSITLPGSHDSLTYDLSLTVSSDGLDEHAKISKWLRKLSIIRPNDIEEFIRLQAMTQKLNIVQQLDNGLRFIDLRISLENTDIGNKIPGWYSIHCLQSNHEVNVYLKLIRNWMDMHPKEIIVIYLSRRGSTDAIGERAYPHTPVEEKQQFWRNYVQNFEDVLFDTSISDYRTTPMVQLLERNHRLVTLASDYEEFTNNSKYAYDAKIIENIYNANCFNEEDSIQQQRDYFFNTKEQDRTKWFSLMGMNTSANDWQVKSALRQRYLPIDLFDPCAKNVNVPGNKMCPRNVLDIAQLTNYYDQISIEEAFQAHLGSDKEVNFPSAFYLDGIDYGGTLRTGTTALFGLGYEGADEEFWYARYAFVDTVIGFNLHSACKNADVTDEHKCELYKSFIDKKREEYPKQLWQESELARHNDWPSSD